MRDRPACRSTGRFYQRSSAFDPFDRFDRFDPFHVFDLTLDLP